MAPGQKTEALTVPTGTRLSYGIELEALVAYVRPSEVDPDEEHSADLAPLLCIEAECDAEYGYEKVSGAIKEHIRQTLCSHGINAQVPADNPPVGVPYHARLDHWDVHSDVTVMDWTDEIALTETKKGEYRWFGLEICSPAFWDETRAYDEIRFAVNVLKSKYRMRVNYSCGFHIHVGNGARYFDAETLKRTGAFLFAADPMLSRLHAPHRRVIDHCESIRYGSRLACLEKFTAEDLQALIDIAAKPAALGRPPKKIDILPVRPWSDRSREEADFGGKEGWERYAKERRQNGPYLTLGALRPSQPDTTIFSSSSSSSSPDHSYNPVDILSTPEDDALRFQKLVADTEFREDCFKTYGDHDPEKLTPSDMCKVLTRHLCKQLFGHKDLGILTRPQLIDLEYECVPYTTIARRRWNWDARPKESIPRPHDDIKQPRPRRIAEQVDHASLEAMAAEQEKLRDEMLLRQQQDDPSSDEFSDDENQLQKFLYNRLDELMMQPTFPLESVDSLLEMLAPARENPKNGPETGNYSTGDGRSLSSSPPSPVPMSNTNTPVYSNESGPSSLMPTPLFANTENRNPTPLLPSRISQGPTLHPHDPSTLPELYKQRIKTYTRIKPREWQRITWLPRPKSDPNPGPPDPLNQPSDKTEQDEEDSAHNNNQSSPRSPSPTQCTRNPRTDTRTGISRLLSASVNSAAAVAALLTSPVPGSRRLNYNFAHYLPGSLAWTHGEKRTIEFREAGGTLDAELAATLARIAVGVVRFCRDAAVETFLEVLEKVVGEEERLRDVFDNGGGGGGGEERGGHDVCDLLEDIGLFAEAAVIRGREARFGPPR